MAFTTSQFSRTSCLTSSATAVKRILTAGADSPDAPQKKVEPNRTSNVSPTAMTNPRPYHLASARTSVLVGSRLAHAGTSVLAIAGRWQGLQAAGSAAEVRGFCSKDMYPGVLPT